LWPVDPSPAISAALLREYLLKVLRTYRHGGRFGTVMDRLAGAYGRAEIEATADYFSRLSYQLPKSENC
jgi:cytochrome c553